MGIIYNRKNQKRVRQYLRSSAPEAERLLWTHLKASRLSGYKFRRQQGVGQYVVDFYCPEKKIAIEIDGATHWTEQEQKKDNKRQKSIETFGIQVLRFTNDDVYTNRDEVLNAILEALEKSDHCL